MTKFLDTVGERYIEARTYLRDLLEKLQCYSGHKPL